ncbi:lipase family protein [Mycobacterium sp. 21AC1]|uniref:lipase family protein n=1 Tax=[Mycobacterium] appelbergii TaxID=2939269 RepID=UPI002938E8A2|nr:lipase family protein [Mycobacterium sp. 21AC1]MDV3127574.1 lipase family protein [Mycobacterium sp. 21AC1]
MARVMALLSVILAVVTGCGGSSEQTATEDPDSAGHVIEDAQADNLDPALHDAASSARTITYASRNGVNDAVSHVTGTVFVPKGSAPAGGFPIVALGHGITGTASDCAPSLSPDLLGEAASVVALLNAGYVVAVPDYQGLGKPSEPDEYDFHPYLDSTTAGFTMIDAVRAARTLVPETSTSWAAVGAREGGQAAWAANELADNYGDDLKLVAAAALAPVADFAGLAEAAMSGTLNSDQKLVYVAYLAALKDEYYYDFELDDYRRGSAEQNWDALLNCSDTMQRKALAEQIPPQDLRPATPAALETLRGYIQKTNLPQGPTQAPMYVIYGGQDSVIPAAWTDRAIAEGCKMGDVIQIAFWPDKGRDQINPVAALGWLDDRMKSLPSANDCPTFTADHTP